MRELVTTMSTARPLYVTEHVTSMMTIIKRIMSSFKQQETEISLRVGFY